jgi:hypothetical protein
MHKKIFTLQHFTATQKKVSCVMLRCNVGSRRCGALRCCPFEGVSSPINSAALCAAVLFLELGALCAIALCPEFGAPLRGRS